MNYRQWKKNYKKKHGCNPPLEVDKRKQAKVSRKALKTDFDGRFRGYMQENSKWICKCI